jgi:hypothetical protein
MRARSAPSLPSRRPDDDAIDAARVPGWADAAGGGERLLRASRRRPWENLPMSARRAAIHQPNFFPWLGYFDKIARADVFVFLDDAQHPATGSTWSNRVRLLIGGEPRWVTAPIKRPAHGTQAIAEVLWAPQPWRERLVKTLHLNYGRAPHYAEAMHLLRPLALDPEPRLAAYNMRAVRELAAALGISTEFRLASEFALSSSATERLIELTRSVGCDTYLTGGGAGGYQEDGLFREAGLRLEYQAFCHPEYPQRRIGCFQPGLSLIDALMHCGIEHTRRLIDSSC